MYLAPDLEASKLPTLTDSTCGLPNGHSHVRDVDARDMATNEEHTMARTTTCSSGAQLKTASKALAKPPEVVRSNMFEAGDRRPLRLRLSLQLGQ